MVSLELQLRRRRQRLIVRISRDKTVIFLIESHKLFECLESKLEFKPPKSLLTMFRFDNFFYLFSVDMQYQILHHFRKWKMFGHTKTVYIVTLQLLFSIRRAIS